MGAAKTEKEKAIAYGQQCGLPEAKIGQHTSSHAVNAEEKSGHAAA
jgi:hypothetical protein